MASPSIDTSRTVAECAANHPSVARVFGEHQIDLCRDGGKPLHQVCRERQLQPEELADEILGAARPAYCEIGVEDDRGRMMELWEHIDAVHHHGLSRQLPALADLVQKVVHVYGAARPELNELQQACTRLRDRLEQHMQVETRKLVPWVRALESDQMRPGPPDELRQLIDQLEHDHAVADEELQRVRRLTNGYSLPARACATYEAMLGAWWELEANLHRKIYEESEYLFPNARRRQAALRGK